VKTVIRYCTTFVLFNASFGAKVFALQQPAGGLAKATMYITPSSYSSLNNDAATIKETKPLNTDEDSSLNHIDTRYNAARARLKQQATELEKYIKANNFNDEYCFLVDMSLPSGKNRFFVYNLKTGSLEAASLVSHGLGSYKMGCNDVLEFSNLPSSYKTALGRYKIGSSYNGTYGLAYKLYGLDSTNDRAFERAIVLHSDAHVPDAEIFPYHIYQSAGCPTVSPAFLTVLTRYIKASKKPILLWVYN